MVKSGHGFKVLSSKTEYENPFFKSIKHQVRRPDGKIKPFWTLSRYGDFSIIIPIFPNNETVLVGQYRIPVGDYSWEFPMGQVRGEDPIKTAKQELLEETGIIGENWKKIGHYYLAPGHNEQEVHVYVVKNLKEGKSHPEEEEVLETQRIGFSEVGRMINDFKIKDGPTIVAYHYLEKHLN
ncbi:MAG: NUDIX hydrolase [Patescibacteria group bacterium]